MNASSGSGLCPRRISIEAREATRNARRTLDGCRSSPLSDAIQDYLKAIYKLQTGEGRVSVTALAREQQRLARLGQRDGQEAGRARARRARAVPRRHASRPAGERVALEVIRHHRLLELYLAETLGLHVDAVHEEADRLEHVLSEELEARIDRRSASRRTTRTGTRSRTPELEWPADASSR